MRDSAVKKGASDAYRQSGVDIDAGSAFARAIAPLARRTARRGASAEIGGFGGVFDLAKTRFQDPLLIAASDGAGTKILLARTDWAWRVVGMDLVAMCVNDLIAQGAEPLFFLDYIASGAINMARDTAIVEGIAEACREARCALIGGETAEMPGLYQNNLYDLAGFAVGAVERGRLLPSRSAKAGDAILGLASNGVHANGFSLLRRIMDEKGIHADSDFPDQSGRSFAETLLTPTRLYVRPILKLLRKENHGVRGLAHITGGGLIDNLPRALAQKGLTAKIRADALPMGEPFGWLKEAGNLSDAEMLRTFNCGVGMALIAAADQADSIAETLEEEGERVIPLGRLQKEKARGKKIEIIGKLTLAADR